MYDIKKKGCIYETNQLNLDETSYKFQYASK